MIATHRLVTCRCGWRRDQPSQAEQERHATDGHAPVQQEHPLTRCGVDCAEPDRQENAS